MSLRILNLNKLITSKTGIRTMTSSTRFYTTTSATMQNQFGQGASHATGGSHVPGTVQDKAPKGVEESLPNSVHDTGSQGRKTHAKDDGEASIVPKPIQKAVPESVERALPDAIHDTGDSKK